MATQRRKGRRGQTTDQAHLKQLEEHRTLNAMIKTRGYVQIGDVKCTTVGAALTALDRQRRKKK